MRDTIGKLCIQTRNATTFQYNILCVLTLVTQKLQVVCWSSRYRMTAVLMEMSIFCVRGGCKILTVRYASKCSPQFLPISHFCVPSVLRRITWKLKVICGSLVYLTTSMLSKTLFVWFRVALEIQLESYGPRHVSVVLWYDVVCVYCKSIHTSLFGTQLRLTT